MVQKRKCEIPMNKDGEVGKKLKLEKEVEEIAIKKDGESNLSTRCRPQGLTELVSNLSDKQKEDIKSIGFDGLLKMQVMQLPTNMLGWLVNRFNGVSRMFRIDDNRKFVITPENICDVFLLPMNSEQTVMVFKKKESVDMVVDLKERFGIDGNLSLLSLKTFLLNGFKKSGEDFKRLFVLYSLSSF